MNVVPKGAPAPTTPEAKPVTSRDRAIQAVIKNNAQFDAPVPNPTQVSPEEMGAIAPSQSRQNAKVEDNASTEVPAADPSSAPAESSEPPLSTQYAVLARKEKALRAKVQAQEAASKAREEALAAREAAIKSKDSEYSTKFISKDQLSQDPWTVLSELGITYEQLTERALSHQQQDPATKAYLARLEAQIKATSDAQERAAKQQQDQQSQAYQNALAQIRQDARTLVANDPNFETIHETNSVNDVVELIERTFKEDKVLLSTEEACELVENQLVEEAMKIARLKKIQSRLSPKPATTAPEALKPEQTKQPQQMKTLTNASSTQRQLSARERAMRAFKGEQ